MSFHLKKNTWIPFIQDALCPVWFKWTQCSWEKKMKMLKFYENTTTTDIFWSDLLTSAIDSIELKEMIYMLCNTKSVSQLIRYTWWDTRALQNWHFFHREARSVFLVLFTLVFGKHLIRSLRTNYYVTKCSHLSRHQPLLWSKQKRTAWSMSCV